MEAYRYSTAMPRRGARPVALMFRWIFLLWMAVEFLGEAWTGMDTWRRLSERGVPADARIEAVEDDGRQGPWFQRRSGLTLTFHDERGALHAARISVPSDPARFQPEWSVRIMYDAARPAAAVQLFAGPIAGPPVSALLSCVAGPLALALAGLSFARFVRLMRESMDER